MSVHAGVLSRIQRFHIINAGMSLAIITIIGVIAVQALGGPAPVAGAVRAHRSGSAGQAGVEPSASPALPLVTSTPAPADSVGTDDSTVGTLNSTVGTGNSNVSSPSSSEAEAPSSNGLLAAPALDSTVRAAGGARTLGTSTARPNARSGKAVHYVPDSAGSLTGTAPSLTGTAPVHGLSIPSAGLAASTPASSSSTASVPSSAPSSSTVSPGDTAAVASGTTDTAPAGPDGTWITPPIPASGTQPALPGVATGPAPAGDVLALGGPGAEYAFDVTTSTWILAPTSGYSYKLGVGYMSGTSSSSDTTDPPATISSLPPGPDGAWIVAPVAATTGANGMALPALPGVAAGPAPAGDVIALGSPGSEYAFDVTTHTWILQSSTSYTYKDGVGYVAAG
jgi:hypothetical protein